MNRPHKVGRLVFIRRTDFCIAQDSAPLVLYLLFHDYSSKYTHESVSLTVVGGQNSWELGGVKMGFLRII